MDTNKLIIYFIIGVISSLALTALILKWLIPYLVKKKYSPLFFSKNSSIFSYT